MVLTWIICVLPSATVNIRPQIHKEKKGLKISEGRDDLETLI